MYVSRYCQVALPKSGWASLLSATITQQHLSPYILFNTGHY